MIKHRDENPPEKSESFWAIDAGYPIACKLVDVNEDQFPLRLQTPTDGLPVLFVGPDDSDPQEMLQEKTSKIWVDVPIAIGGWTVGKLSCDFRDPEISLDTTNAYQQIQVFSRYANVAAPFLETLRNQSFSSPLRYAAQAINATSDFNDLAAFIVNGLRTATYFNCENADFFTSVLDSEKPDDRNMSIVLRKTSYAPMHQFQGCHGYPLTDEISSLTAWVAHHKQSIRVYDMLDPELRKQQLEVYGTDIHWEQVLPVSHKHRSLLIAFVPIDSGEKSRNNSFGVIRLADKRDAGGNFIPFDERDQSLLEKIASQAIGPKLLALRHEHVASTIRKLLLRFNNLEIGGPYERPWRELLNLTAEAIPEDRMQLNSKKRYFINAKNSDGTLQILASEGSLERNDDSDSFESAGSLSGHAIDADRVVCISDLDTAANNNQYRKMTTNASCAMACSIKYRDDDLGAVAVVSSHNDLSLDEDGYVLQAIASEAASVIEHRRVYTSMTLMSGVHHDFQAALEALYVGQQRLGIQNKDEQFKFGKKIQCLSALASVHCVSNRPDEIICDAEKRFMQIREALIPVCWLAKDLLEDSDLTPINVDNVDIDWHAYVIPNSFQAAMLNVIRNAVENCADEGVRISGKRVADHLLVSVENSIGDLSPPRRRRITASKFRKGLGIPILERVLEWYRFTNTKSASMDVVTVGNVYRVDLKFPLPTDVESSELTMENTLCSIPSWTKNATY